MCEFLFLKFRSGNPPRNHESFHIMSSNIATWKKKNGGLSSRHESNVENFITTVLVC